MKYGINLKGVPQGKMPHNITPMMAKLSGPFDNKDWLFEPKWDGYRAILEKQSDRIRLYSRKNITLNEDYPEIIEELKGMKYDTVIDGEITVVDKKGVPKFQLLQDYKKRRLGNLVYYVFDILYLDGFVLTDQSLIKRKEILRSILKESDRVKYSDHIEEKGIDFFKMAKKIGLEGIMAKHKESSYIMKRTDRWRKIKAKNRQEAVVAGYTQGRRGRKNFGALVLGAYKGGKLVYIGHAGTGFSEQALDDLKEKMKRLSQKQPPFKNPPKTNMPVTWLKPLLVAEIDFQEWTNEGVMRQPVFLGLREDKEPKEVRIEK